MAMKVQGGQFVERSVGKKAISAQRYQAAKEVDKALYTIGAVARMGSAIGPRERQRINEVMRTLDNLSEQLSYPDSDPQ